MDYTKVFAIGVAKSKSVEVMKLFAKYIQAILDGEVNPSAKTPDTFPRVIKAGPAANNFGDFQYTNRTTRLSSWITALTPPICSALPIGAVRRKF